MNSVSNADTERWKIAKTNSKTIAHEHSYHASARTVQDRTAQRNTYHQGWKVGRRIVNLGFLAEGLRCCKKQ